MEDWFTFEAKILLQPYLPCHRFICHLSDRRRPVRILFRPPSPPTTTTISLSLPPSLMVVSISTDWDTLAIIFELLAEIVVFSPCLWGVKIDFLEQLGWIRSELRLGCDGFEASKGCIIDFTCTQRLYDWFYMHPKVVWLILQLNVTSTMARHVTRVNAGISSQRRNFDRSQRRNFESTPEFWPESTPDLKPLHPPQRLCLIRHLRYVVWVNYRMPKGCIIWFIYT